MLPRLSEVLYWAGWWIAVTVAMLTLAALLSNTDQAWTAVITYAAVAIAIWLFGRAILFLSKLKR